MKRITSLLLFCILLLPSCAGPVGNAPTWQEQYDLGLRYLSEGNYQEAILAFTAAIEIDPKQAPAYVGRGDAYVLSGETEENLTAAKADYETAISLDEALAEAYLGLADVYIWQGDNDRALEILRQGLEATGSAALQERLDELEGTDGSGDGGTSGEPGTSTEAAGTLSLSDISYKFERSEDWSGNEGAIGCMYISGTGNGPANTRNVLIAAFSQEPFSQTQIEENIIPNMTAIWKGEFSADQNTPPFPFGQGFPVWAENQGTTMYVVLIGLDENIDATGYAVVTVQIPA